LLRLQANGETATSRKGAVSAPAATYTATSAAQDNTKSFATEGGPACTTSKLRSYDITVRPALIARGTVAGAPVTILIYDGSGNSYAYVIRVSDCSLVRKQSLG
jgi:hypothetical protein